MRGAALCFVLLSACLVRGWPRLDRGRVWTFMIGDNWGGYEYLDDNGFAQGFNAELVKAVCEFADEECYWMMDTYSNCWQTDGESQYPGRGLMDGWYDACTGASPTKIRENSFDFSLPYADVEKVTLMYKNRDEGMANVRDKRIGFVKGWINGPDCFKYQYGYDFNQPGQYESVMFDTHQEMIDAVKNGDVDACVTSDKYSGLEPVDLWFGCADQGASLMAPYGSKLLEWWDDAFQAFVDSGEYAQFCRAQRRKHGYRGDINCLG